MLLPRRLGVHAAALVLFGILPARSFFGRWEAYLSGALYSGNLKGRLDRVRYATKFLSLRTCRTQRGSELSLMQALPPENDQTHQRGGDEK